MLIRKSPLLVFTCMATLSLFLLTSCQDEKKPSDTQQAQAGDAANNNLVGQQVAWQMNCVTLTKAQIQTWVDSGWTNPTNPNAIKKILLQFYSADATGANTNMQLIAYPGKSYTNVNVTGKQTLVVDTTCTAMNLTGQVILANNFVNLKSLKIIKADGTLEDFSFIRLRPIHTYAPYINFEVEVVRLEGLQEQQLFKGGSDPCPPYCPGDDGG